MRQRHALLGARDDLGGLEDELARIRSLKVSLHKQRAEIDYDEKKITEGRDPAGVRARGLRALPSLTL